MVRNITCILTILVVYALVLTSCNTDCEECDESIYCNTVRPDSGDVYIDLTYQTGNDPVIVELYNGKVDDGDLISKDTIYYKDAYYRLPAKEKYAAKAFYTRGAETIVVINAGRLTYDKFCNCNETCYEEEDLRIDLMLLK